MTGGSTGRALSILYLRCGEPGAGKTTDALHLAFNSLFEMQIKSLTVPDSAQNFVAFNSLFEMRRWSGMWRAEPSPGQLSILYLRCTIAVKLPDDLAAALHFQFSI